MRLETWSKWRSHVEAEGMEFAAAPVYEVWPGDGGLSLKPYQAAVRAARETVEARFTERSMVERYEQSFNQLAATRSRRENLRRRAAAH